MSGSDTSEDESDGCRTWTQGFDTSEDESIVLDLLSSPDDTESESITLGPPYSGS